MHLEDLERLARLRDQGVLSNEEFEREKARLLSDPHEPEQQSYFEDKVPRRGGRVLVGLLSLVLVGGGAAWFAASGLDQSTASPPSKIADTSDRQFTSTNDVERPSETTQAVTENETIAAVGDDSDAEPPTLPRFSEYSVPPTNVVAPLKLLRGSWFWDYRTRIQDAYESDPNFGANAVVTVWGCGTGCRFGAVVDRSNGEIYSAPLGGEDYQSLEYMSERGSNLLLATWNDGYGEEAKCVFEAFVWKGQKFDPVSGYPIRKDGACPFPDE